MIENGLKVSICMITYNHELFVSDAIDSFLNQRTNFLYEIVIGEDFSKDITRNICEDYKRKFPTKIKLLASKNNLGVMPNFIRTLDACMGQYIALCEGDDYWTDPYKLQKQVDFLEANQEFSLCLHNAEILERNGRGKKFFNNISGKNTFNTIDLLSGELRVITHSIVLRSAMLELPTWINFIQQGDLAIMLLMSLKGSIYFIDDLMGVYRKHGTSLGATTSEVKSCLRKLDLYSYFDLYTNFKFHKEILKCKDKLRQNIYYNYLKEAGIFKRYLNVDYLIIKLGFLWVKIQNFKK